MKPNAKCLYCGKPYYVCRTCAGIYSWKQVCDTPECYRKYIAKLDTITEQTKTVKFGNITEKQKPIAKNVIDLNKKNQEK